MNDKQQKQQQPKRRGVVGVEWLVLLTALAGAGVWMARSHAAAFAGRPARTAVGTAADVAAAPAAADAQE